MPNRCWYTLVLNIFWTLTHGHNVLFCPMLHRTDSKKAVSRWNYGHQYVYIYMKLMCMDIHIIFKYKFIHIYVGWEKGRGRTAIKLNMLKNHFWYKSLLSRSSQGIHTGKKMHWLLNFPLTFWENFEHKVMEIKNSHSALDPPSAQPLEMF